MQDSRSQGEIAMEAADVGQRSIESRVTDVSVRLGIVALFAYLSLTLIAPFAIIIIWAVILAVALFPLYAGLRRHLGGRSGLAATVITFSGLVVIIGPLAAVAISFADAASTLFAKLGDGAAILPMPAESVRSWPLIGEQAFAAWSLASSNFEAALQRFGPHLLPTGTAILGKIAGIGFGVLGFAVSMIVAGCFLGPGVRLVEGVKGAARRIAGENGAHFVDLAGATIRNISRGVIGVALLQALLVGAVLAVFDVPASGAIAFVLLLFCIVQVGPAPVVLPVMIWAWMTMEFGPALLMTLLLAPTLVIDNVLKPVLMARGLATPVLVILIGVIGGTLSYGLIGLFLGPIVLGVFYELLMAWIKVDLPVTVPQGPGP